MVGVPGRASRLGQVQESSRYLQMLSTPARTTASATAMKLALSTASHAICWSPIAHSGAMGDFIFPYIKAYSLFTAKGVVVR